MPAPGAGPAKTCGDKPDWAADKFSGTRIPSSLDFVGSMKTFHTSVDIPGCTAMDYHLVCAQPEVISNFHRLHNGDEKAHVGKWAPVNFDEAPDLTKRRTVLYTSQLNIPTWLRKILGRSFVEVRNEQETTFNRANGNLTISSRPLITALGRDGGKSEYELASEFYQILNRKAADGSAYITVDVTVTAKADQPWLWGVQSAVEAIFITQAKDDILSYLEYSVRLFKELHAMQQLPSQQKARAAKTPRGGRSTPRHVSSGARPAEAPRRVCFSPCTPDVLGHSRAPAAALAPPRRAIDAQEGTPQTVPPMARNAADKTSTTQSALKGQAHSGAPHIVDILAGSSPDHVYYDALEDPSDPPPAPRAAAALQESPDEDRMALERARPQGLVQHRSEAPQCAWHAGNDASHAPGRITAQAWETGEPVAQHSHSSHHAEAAQDMPTPTTHRHAKPEARSHRTPQTARPAKGGASHEDRYEGPSNPYVDVEWEDSPPVGTKGKDRGGARTPRQVATTPLRDLVPGPEAGDTTMQGADTSDDEDWQVQRSSGAGGPAFQKLQQAIWEANGYSDKQESEKRSTAPMRTARSAREMHEPQEEQSRYYIIMPADGAASREQPRVLEEVYVEGVDAGYRKCLALREVDSQRAQAYLSAQPTQRHVKIANHHTHGRPSRAPAIATKEPALPARQPSREGSSKQRGSQTARESSSRSLSDARKEMYESKRAAEAALRRASADHELVQSEAQHYSADERHAISTQKHLKKRSWFMKLFTGQNRSRA